MKHILNFRNLLCGFAITVQFCVTIASAQVPITGKSGATLQKLASTSTLVTVVLKNGSEDKNLRITEVLNNKIVVESTTGQNHFYLYEQIREVRVQAGVSEVKRFELNERRTLTNDEIEARARAEEVAKSVFQTANANQSLKMKAARVVLGLNSEDEEARGYLDTLIQGNDLGISLDAMTNLYLALGTGNSTAILERGIASGNQQTRATSAALACITKDQALAHPLGILADHRSSQIAAPSMRALGNIGDTSSLETLYKAIGGINDAKGDAARDALIALGGQTVIDRLHELLETTKGLARFRVIQVLYALEDEEGTSLLETESLKSVATANEAAITLAPSGNWEAKEYLRAKLEKRMDNTEENLLLTSRASVALIAGGFTQAQSNLQELFRMTTMDVYAPGSNKEMILKNVKIGVCQEIAVSGLRRLVPLLMAPMASNAPGLMTEAADAVLSLTDSDYRDRLALHLQNKELDV